MTQKRPKFQTRRILLRAESQRETALALIRNLPLDFDHPLELVAREEIKVRKPDANAEYWAGPLKDIAEQAWIGGRQFSAEVLHHHFKLEFLPDPDDPDFDETHVKDGYRKWDYTPVGERVLVGSTTQLTSKGFAVYREQVVAFGAGLGVQFHASPNESRRSA